MDVILKPETTDKYHHIPVRDKNLFVSGSFRTIDISIKKGIKAIIGKLKSDPQGSTVVQKYLFDINKWTMEEAKQWVKDNKKSLLSLIELYKDIDISGDESKKIIRSYKAKVLSVDKENHTVKARVSTEDMDRHNEVILLSGWKKHIKSYKEHAVLLSSHNYRELRSQIGEAQEIDINDKGMDLNFHYYVGEGNQEADWAFVLASKGKAMYSVGFLPVKTLYGDQIPEELAEKYKGKLRAVYTEAELLEVSQVVVGSNRGALQMGIDQPDAEQCSYMFEVVRDFGSDIPDFDVETKDIPADPPAPEGPDNPDKKNKLTEDSLIIAPIEIKNMKEMGEFVEIWKSGRVISEKNKKIIQGAIDQLSKSVEVLSELLKLTEPKEEGGGGEAGKGVDIDAILRESNELLKKIKS